MTRLILQHPTEVTSTQFARLCGVTVTAVLKWEATGRIERATRRGRKRIWSREYAEKIASFCQH